MSHIFLSFRAWGTGKSLGDCESPSRWGRDRAQRGGACFWRTEDTAGVVPVEKIPPGTCILQTLTGPLGVALLPGTLL